MLHKLPAWKTTGENAVLRVQQLDTRQSLARAQRLHFDFLHIHVGDASVEHDERYANATATLKANKASRPELILYPCCTHPSV